jgi:hypothetical protein
MNNTKTRTTLAIAAVLMTATLVVGVTFAATSAQSAFAGGREGNENGNTITIQACKQKAYQSGWDNTQEQECGNTICTHPSSDGACVKESSETPKVTPPPKDDGSNEDP